MGKKIKNKYNELEKLFRNLLLREESVNINNPLYMSKWLEEKVKLLSCWETINEIERILKEDNSNEKTKT